MDLSLEKTNNDNLTEIIIKSSKYDHNKKIELANKINKIKKKDYLVQIFKIIATGSKDFTENTNGVFVFFHNLDDDTYEKVESYVNYIYKLHKKKNSVKSILSSELSDSIINYSDTLESEIQDSENDSSMNKELSNKEKMIMRRKKYEEYLTQNQKI